MSATSTRVLAVPPPLADPQPRIRSRTVTRHPHRLALAMGGIATAVLLWGVDRPALWLDESASVVATQRTWADLWVLLRAADAPLVPYYALLKAASSATVLVAP